MPHSGQRIVALNAGMSSKLSGSVSMPLKKSCPVCGQRTIRLPIGASELRRGAGQQAMDFGRGPTDA
jgi:hypothetical protein